MSSLIGTSPGMTMARSQALATAIAAFPTWETLWEGLVSASMDAGLLSLPTGASLHAREVGPRENLLESWDASVLARA